MMSKQIKQLLQLTLGIGLGWISFSAPAAAQLQLGDRLIWCYMVDPDQQLSDLSYLCVKNTATRNESIPEVSGATESPDPEVFTSDLAAYYADQYCVARARGSIGIDAEKFAGQQLAQFMVTMGINSSVVTLELIQEADENAKILCPELMPQGRYD